ncbi:hypothetical protein GHT56_21490 [Pseudomonas aeruginosa]|nr:hypothetical protein [Pseudomonas aeruginosa]MBG4198220.1 hypothetical protein [Pseudomonas aeruginosa]
MTDTNKLKELAERASVGDWSYSPCIEGQPFFGQVWDAAGDSLCVMDHMTGQANADGDYIAAANPKSILNLIAEVERLRIGLKGDYDLDAWLEWTREKDRLKAENDELRRLCSCAKQYDLSMTLRRMIDAVLEGDKP